MLLSYIHPITRSKQLLTLKVFMVSDSAVDIAREMNICIDYILIWLCSSWKIYEI